MAGPSASWRNLLNDQVCRILHKALLLPSFTN